MSERASIRGGRGGGRGGPAQRGNNQGGRGGAQSGALQNSGERERPKKENILDLSKYTNKTIIVKFNGGREARGTLKGFDQLMNLVLDDVVEDVYDEEGEKTQRKLGLLVARGTLLTSIAPEDGSEEIANPFAGGEGEDVMDGEE